MGDESNIEAVLRKSSPQVRELAETLRKLIREVVPEVAERGYTGWGNIVYDHNGVFCYIAPLKDSVNLGFYRGIDLPDPEGLLRGTGKSLRHVKIKKSEDINADVLQSLVLEAYRLTED